MAYVSALCFQSRCRKLLCPFGRGHSAGRCKPLTMVMNNLVIDVALDLRINRELTKRPTGIQTAKYSLSDGEDISNSVLKALNLKTYCLLYSGVDKQQGYLITAAVRLYVQAKSRDQLRLSVCLVPSKHRQGHWKGSQSRLKRPRNSPRLNSV